MFSGYGVKYSDIKRYILIDLVAMFILFIGFIAQRLKVCRTLDPTACLKMLTEKLV